MVRSYKKSISSNGFTPKLALTDTHNKRHETSPSRRKNAPTLAAPPQMPRGLESAPVPAPMTSGEFRARLKNHPRPPLDVTHFKDLSGMTLRSELRSAEGPGRVFQYGEMRNQAYNYVYGRAGRVFDYYTNREVDRNQVNWEHIFAQSWKNLRGSIWQPHMFNGVPTDPRPNAERGNLPFGEIADSDSVKFQNGVVRVGLSDDGKMVAEVNKERRGDIALRGLWMFTEAPEFLPPGREYREMLAFFVKWLLESPPDAEALQKIGLAEELEEETLYYAHCPKDLVLRAFTDILGEFKEQPEFAPLYEQSLAAIEESRQKLMARPVTA